MKIYTSEEILKAEDLYELQDQDTIFYQMTEGEIGWFNFILGKYSIADYVKNNSYGNFLLKIDAIEISQAMDNDCKDFGKAVMLSDDTALQKIFFWIYIEDTE